MLWETRLTVNHENHKAATSTLIGKFHFMIISCSGNAHEYGQCSQGRRLSAELHQKSFCNICNLMASFFTPWWICRGCAPLHFYSLRTPDSPKKQTQKQLEEPASSNLYTCFSTTETRSGKHELRATLRNDSEGPACLSGPSKDTEKARSWSICETRSWQSFFMNRAVQNLQFKLNFCASKRRKHKLNISLYELFLPKPTIFTIENKKTIKWIRLFRKHERLSWRTRFHFMIFLFPIVKIVCFGKNNS